MSIATGRQATVSLEIGGQRDHLRDRQARQAGRRRSRRPLRRHDDPRDGRRPDGEPPRCGLLPADDRRRGADVRRREDPRRLFQARRQGVRAGDPDRAHDRPPDPAALAEGLQERGAGHLHRPLRGHGPRPRRPLHQRRLRGARDLAAAVPRPGGRGARRPDRRRARRQPDAAGGRRGLRPRPDRRRHARRADDDRGRRRPGPRGHDVARVRARSHRDQAHLRRHRRSARAGRQAEVGRSGPDGRARVERTATRSGSGFRRRA